MSGIVGVLHLDGSPSRPSIVRAMTEAVRPNAADTRDTWVDGPIALGQAAFSTTVEARYEDLPLQAGPFTLVADARVDNRKELLTQLDSALVGLGLRSAQRPVTDADLLLAAYARWGRDAPRHVIGDYAFAVWDSRDQTLFCATDVFGVRPLYTSNASGSFYFATEPLGLFAGGVPRIIDEERVHEIMITGSAWSPDRTLFRGIRLLPGGHAFIVSQDTYHEWQHTTIEPSPDPVPPSDQEIEDRFLDLFYESVRCRMRGNDRVGAQLSGGLDSSAVACIARDVLQSKGDSLLDTFTLAFEATPEVDEGEFVESVLRTGGFRPHTLSGDSLGPLSNLEEVYAAMADGPAAGTQHFVWALCKAAGDAGVRVLLDGIDGDRVVEHGQNRLLELAQEADWDAFFQEAQALVDRHRGVDRLHSFESDFGTSASYIFSGYGMPALNTLAQSGPPWAFARSLYRASRHGARPLAILKRVWRRVLVPAPLLRRFRPQSIGRTYNVRADQAEALRNPKLGRGLALASHAAAAHGVELAHPFLDIRLVRYCLSLPASQSLRDGWTRSILRRGLRDKIPPRVRDRVGKTSMSPAYFRGLFEIDVDRLHSLAKDSGMTAPYLNESRFPERVDQLSGTYASGGSIDGGEAALLGAQASMLTWLRHQATESLSSASVPEE